MPKFGKTAKEWEETRGSEDEVWIKNFREGETRIRFLEEPDDMITYLEHYDEGIGYFPCSEERDCVGCTDTSTRTRQRSRRFAFHAYNDRGQLQVFKVGSRVHKQLQSKFQRLGSICDRDYTIIRSGQGKDTTYDVEFGEKYPVADSGERHDIPALLAEKYAATVAGYKGEEVANIAGAEPKDDAEPAAPAGRIAPSSGRITPGGGSDEPSSGGRIAPTKAAPAKAAPRQREPERTELDSGDEAQAETTSNGNGHAGVEASGKHPDVTDLSAPRLREYLAAKKVDYPKNAPRSRLVTIAQEWQKEFAPWDGDPWPPAE